jgi:glutamate-5-semialdehyde dehydrogenase
MPHALPATEKDFSTEFLDSILAVKSVPSARDALSFIKSHTHGHTEILAAKDKSLIETFVNEIDAAGLMINCSSRLHDGGEFEMGAEMGTATGKLHARGPVGIRELTTYKWIAYGNGQVKQ